MSEIKPLAGVSDKLNQIRILSIILKDTIRDLTDEERKQLVSTGELSRRQMHYMRSHLWLLVRGVLKVGGVEVRPLPNKKQKPQKNL